MDPTGVNEIWDEEEPQLFADEIVDDDEWDDPAEILPGMMNPPEPVEVNPFNAHPMSLGQRYRNMQDRYNMSMGRQLGGRWRRSHYMRNGYDPEDDAFAYDVGHTSRLAPGSDGIFIISPPTNTNIRVGRTVRDFLNENPNINLNQLRRNQTQMSVNEFRIRNRPAEDFEIEDPSFTSPNWIENLSIGQYGAGATINRYLRRFRQLRSANNLSRVSHVSRRRGMPDQVTSYVSRYL